LVLGYADEQSDVQTTNDVSNEDLTDFMQDVNEMDDVALGVTDANGNVQWWQGTAGNLAEWGAGSDLASPNYGQQGFAGGQQAQYGGGQQPAYGGGQQGGYGGQQGGFGGQHMGYSRRRRRRHGRRGRRGRSRRRRKRRGFKWVSKKIKICKKSFFLVLRYFKSLLK